MSEMLAKALIRAAECMDECNALNSAVQHLVRRVLSVTHLSTFDGRAIESLQNDLDRQSNIISTQLAAARRDASNNKNMSDTDKRYLNELIVFNTVLEETGNQLKEKIRILTKFSRSALNVSDFKFVRAIGKGGFGSVYLAQRLDNKKLCAIKVNLCLHSLNRPDCV